MYLTILKLFLTGYRLIITLTALAAPCWFINQLKDVDEECQKIPFRAAIVMLIGCTMLEYSLLSFMRDRSMFVQLQYVPALFSSDISMMGYAIYLYGTGILNQLQMTVIGLTCTIMIILRFVYLRLLSHKAEKVREKYFYPSPEPDLSQVEVAWNDSRC